MQIDHLRSHIVNWIKKEVVYSKTKGVVLGLSGGLDSSVVAFLAKEALGKDRVLALILSCHSQNQDMVDAKLVIRLLGIKRKLIDLSKTYDYLLQILPKADRLTQANLKTRLRMSILYYFANKLNYLVCGTSNKSELMVGYFTKYGDGAADILPIGDLLKTQVRQLAVALGVPKRIIVKPPTAGLWPGQTDEEEMGIVYSELDDILERIQKKRRQIISEVKVNQVKAMIERSEHKREVPKICKVN
ncbi:MAG: NAD+ synthase [Candidatus Omnitrophica bacterium]|nr:NAD+ synthase [Candidatus Omnitrophota bacterium]